MILSKPCLVVMSYIGVLSKVDCTPTVLRRAYSPLEGSALDPRRLLRPPLGRAALRELKLPEDTFAAVQKPSALSMHRPCNPESGKDYRPMKLVRLAATL